MNYERFEAEVLQWASQGGHITAPNLAAYLHIQPGQIEQWLDRMARTGRLEIEIEETHGYVYYRVPGLTPIPQTMAPIRKATPQMIRQKNTTAGILLALLLPGLGLWYAAPFGVAIVFSVLTMIGTSMLGALPVIGSMLSSLALGVAALSSGVLGAVYVKQYNRIGQRTYIPWRHIRRHAADVAAAA